MWFENILPKPDTTIQEDGRYFILINSSLSIYKWSLKLFHQRYSEARGREVFCSNESLIQQVFDLAVLKLLFTCPPAITSYCRYVFLFSSVHYRVCTITTTAKRNTFYHSDVCAASSNTWNKRIQTRLQSFAEHLLKWLLILTLDIKGFEISIKRLSRLQLQFSLQNTEKVVIDSIGRLTESKAMFKSLTSWAERNANEQKL